MSGLFRADWIRLGRRRSLQAIVIGVPLLAATFFLLNFRATDVTFGFNEADERASLTQQFTQQGMTPEDVKAQVDQIIEGERDQFQQMAAQIEATRATYAFPASVVTLLSSATVVYFFGMILLTATTLGDEFGWGTIRTSLLASSNRRRWLTARLVLLSSVAVVGLAALLLLTLVLPLVIAAVVGHLPQSPPLNQAGVAVLLGGHLISVIMLIGFAAAATVLMRSGALTLVGALVYTLVETLVVGLLGRLEPFRPANFFGQGNPAGPFEWALNLFPMHAIQAWQTTASQVAVSTLETSVDVGGPVLADSFPPLASVAAWAVIFITVAMLRFTRMDIAE